MAKDSSERIDVVSLIGVNVVVLDMHLTFLVLLDESLEHQSSWMLVVARAHRLITLVLDDMSCVDVGHRGISRLALRHGGGHLPISGQVGVCLSSDHGSMVSLSSPIPFHLDLLLRYYDQRDHELRHGRGNWGSWANLESRDLNLVVDLHRFSINGTPY